MKPRDFVGNRLNFLVEFKIHDMYIITLLILKKNIN